MKGQTQLNENNLNEAEQSIAKALRILSALLKGKNFNEEKAQCFHSLAELFLLRASKQIKKEDYCEMVIKSIALFEAERIYKHGTYTNDEVIDSAISKAEVSLVARVFGADAVKRLKIEGDRKTLNRVRLNEIRSRISNQYFRTLAKHPKWGSEDEEERCNAIERVYEAIHNDMKRFIGEMLHYCSEIAGAAPCNFSVLGLGSTSRMEGTPYSDLEFAILIDPQNGDDDDRKSEQRAYFRYLTYIFHSQIVQLGETILPSLGIPCLNDFYSDNKEDDWFYDDVIPKGFSFDGMMPWASKTPLGTKAWREEPPQEFIMTVDEMLELQNVVPASYSKSVETANVFSSVCHLYGDADLTESYKTKLLATLSNTDRVKTFQQQVLMAMQNLSETYQIETLESRNYGTQQNVKKEVYRLASLLVEQISNFFGIFHSNSWQCLKEMRESAILTPDGAKNLRAALSITTELRLQCYQKHGRQKEALPMVPQLSIDEKESTTDATSTAIVRLYASLLPLKMVIAEVLENHESVDPESFMRSLLLQEKFMDGSPVTTALAYLRILQLPKALACLSLAKEYAKDDATKASVLLVLAQCYRMVGRFQEVFDFCQEVRNLYSTTQEIVNSENLRIADIMVMLTYMDMGLYRQAVKLYEQIIKCFDLPDFKEKHCTSVDDVDFLNNSAVLFMKMGQYRTAENILRHVIDKLPNPRKNYSNFFVCINNLAVILLEEDRLMEARSILQSALSVASELYGENAIHPHLACCLTNLAKVCYRLQNASEATRLLQLSLIIYRRVHHQQLIEPGIVEALLTQAKVFEFLGKWEKMRTTLLEAKDVALTLYGDQPHPSTASVLVRLGFCEQVRGRYAAALNHYQNCLKIREDHCKESGHACETASALLRISSLGKTCSSDTSYVLSLIKRAIEIEEQVHGKGSDHVHLAICLTWLGYRLMQGSSGSDGLQYIENAILMFKEIKLNDTFDCAQAHLTMAKVLENRSPNEAEEHLKIAKAILKRILKDENHIILVEINSLLLNVLRITDRIPQGLELAEVQKNYIDERLSKSIEATLRELYPVFRLAEFYEASGRRNTARVIYTNLISHLEGQVDPNDPENDYLMLLLWMTQEAVATIYQGDEMFQEAEAMIQRYAVSSQKFPSERSFVQQARLIAQWELATIFTETGRYSQAYGILDRLVNSCERDMGFNNSMLAMAVYRLLGELYRRRCLLPQAFQHLNRALKISEDCRAKATPGNISRRVNEAYAKVMNAIGLVYEAGNSPKQALECYKCCLHAVEEVQPTMDTATFHQNMADTLKQLSGLDDALIHYEKSLKIREKLHSEDPVREDVATVLYKIALTHFMSDRPEKASETLDKLLPLRRNLLERGGVLQNYCAAIVLRGNCYIVQPGEAQKAKDAYEEAEKVLKKITEGQLNPDYAMVVSNIGVICYVVFLFLPSFMCLPNSLCLAFKDLVRGLDMHNFLIKNVMFVYVQ